jgi:quercetin dioxygenase-like cupin family protein
MKQNFISNCLLIAGASLILVACNQQEKKEESTAATDTTATQTTAATEPAAPTIPDAVTAAPNLYKVLKDTMGIRVLEVLYNAGDSSALHSHPDNVLYVVSGGKTEFTEKDGSKHVNEFKDGFIGIQPGSVHSVKNVGTKTVKAILFEVSRPNNPGAAADAALDPTKVASGLYKLNKDTMNLRVLTTIYKAGASSKLHSHPDHVGYVIEGGTVEFTAKDGTKTMATFPTGAVLAAPAGPHSVKNTGKSNIKVLLVEVNRAG